MLVPPFYNDDVLSPFADQIVHVVIVAPRVLHRHLVARSFRPVHADVENVIAYKRNETFFIREFFLNFYIDKILINI